MRRLESYPDEVQRAFETVLSEGHLIVPSKDPHNLRRLFYRYREALVAADSPLALRYANIRLSVADDQLILDTKND